MRINFARQLKATARMIAHQAGYAERLGAHRDRPFQVGFEPDILRHRRITAAQLKKLRDEGIDKRQAVAMLQATLSASERVAEKLVPDFALLNEPRRAAIVSLVYFGGDGALRDAKRGGPIRAAIHAGDFGLAGELIADFDFRRVAPICLADLGRQMRLGRWVGTTRNSTPAGWPRG